MKRSQSRNGRIESLESRTLFSGGLDPTFGTGGYVVGPTPPAPVDYSGNDANLQVDGKLLFSGYNSASGQLEVRRYLANGKADASFGINGVTAIHTNYYNRTYVTQTATGKILVADPQDVYQLTTSGKIDPTFATGGKLDLGSFGIGSLTIQGTEFLLGGSDTIGMNSPAELRRYSSNGSLDSTFGTGGIISVAGIAGDTNSFTQIFVTRAGNIAAGETSTSSPVYSDYSVYLFDGNGAAVKKFGYLNSGNIVLFAGYFSTVALVGAQPDGSLLYTLGGELSRLTALGATDTTFTPIQFSGGEPEPAAVEADGSILVIESGTGQTVHYSPSGIKETTSVPITGYGNLAQSSGKILPLADGSYVLIGGGSFFIEKLTAAGMVDTSFGIGGEVAPVTPATPPLVYEAVAIQSDRKVIAGGLAFNGIREVFDLTRYNVNGSLDTTFGSAGVAQTQIGFSNVQDISLLIQPDGKIVAAGDLAPAVNSASITGFAIIRCNTNGSLDQSFGSNGVVLFKGDQSPVLAYQNGKLIVGTAHTVQRLNANGAIDTTFAKGLPAASTLAIESDGKILVGTAVFNRSELAYDTYFNRYNIDGSHDTAFGKRGTVEVSMSEVPQKIVVESDGTIVVLEVPGGRLNSGAYQLNAINPNGSADLKFGSSGVLILQQQGGMESSQSRDSLLVSPTGQLLVTQQTSGPPGLARATQVFRYSATGFLDTTFGNDGATTVVSTEVATNGSFTVGSIAAIDGTGRLYLAGGVANTTSGTMAPNLVAIDTNNDTGTITGYMFYDFNGNGKRDPGDHALNWTCYIDVDNDGHYDNADIRIYTDAAGHFTIPNLAPGVYHIRQSQVSHWQKTTPAEYTVTVTTGATSSGVNFGSRFIG